MINAITGCYDDDDDDTASFRLFMVGMDEQ